MAEDMYEGKYLTVWGDEDFIYFSIPWVTFHIPHGENFNDFLTDIYEFSKPLKEKHLWDDNWNKKMLGD